jgi:predicted RNA-binding Zn ribbon-like protein
MVLPPTRPEDVEGIPQDAAVLHSFMNTLDQRAYRAHGRLLEGGDRLDNYESLEHWLLEHRLLAAPLQAIPAGKRQRAVESALALRKTMRDAADDTGRAQRRAESGETPTAVETLAQFGLVPHTSESGVSLTVAPPSSDDLVPEVHRALGLLVIMAVELSINGSWKRLKMCPAPDCRWVFYDRSRPRTARWCSPALCGNRYKQRRAHSRTRSSRLDGQGSRSERA